MLDESVALKVLLRDRHWTYDAFCVEYNKAASLLDPRLARSSPSRAQFQRWLAGDLRRLPHPDACRVLEALFPGWQVEQLLASYTQGQAEEESAELATGDGETRPVVVDRVPDRYQDVTAIYGTRSEFASNVPPHSLFSTARSIRACGLSLNLLCQQYSAHGLRELVERGGSIECLFLDPDGEAIRRREQEESYQPGTLSELTRINIRSLQERVRDQLPEEARSRLRIGTYDETIRLNIILVDDSVGIVQPYLPAMRGIDSPTFVLRRRWQDRGLYPVLKP